MSAPTARTLVVAIGALILAPLLAGGATPVGAEHAEAPAGPERSAASVIASGEQHTCARVGNGGVICWGSNASGELGLGDVNARGDSPGEVASLVPVDVGAGRRAASLTAGGSHSCAVFVDGALKCWGSNASGELGIGSAEKRGDQPGEMGDALPAVDLGSGRTAVAAAAGANHTCAVLVGGSVKCWGYNQYGELGVGAVDKRGDQPGEMGDALPAVDLGSGRTATAISAGGHHTCALLDDGSVKCWGHNALGQLGLSDTANRGDQPGEMGDALPAVDLGPGRTAVAVGAGGNHTCAVLDDASLKCWGGNGSGQLGLGDVLARGDGGGELGSALAAVPLGAGRSVRSIAVGGGHTCAVLDDASVSCWGANQRGQLGVGDVNARGDQPGEMGAARPVVDLGPGRAVLGLTVSSESSCALVVGGTLVCWGRNDDGQLGVGDTSHRGDNPGEMGAALTPAQLAAAVTVPALAGDPGPATTAELVPLVPARLLDTRVGGSTADGTHAGGGVAALGSVTRVIVAGRGGVPSDAGAAVLNVTAVGPGGAGFATVFACDAARPNASNLNFQPGEHIPNTVVAKLAADGSVCIFTSVDTHLLVDVNAFLPASSPIVPVQPARLLDTRPGGSTIDATHTGEGTATADSVTRVMVAGRGGVPADAGGMILNVTAVGPVAAGFATVFPCDAAQPNASNLNFRAGQDIPNVVVAKVAADGSVCVFTSADTHLLVDVGGYLPAGAATATHSPVRLLDTRPGGSTADATHVGSGVLAGGSVTNVIVAGRGGIPAGASAALLNVTAVGATGPGFATVFPCDAAPPNASNLNYRTGEDIANAVVAKLATDGSVCVFTSATTHVLIDAAAYLPG